MTTEQQAYDEDAITKAALITYIKVIMELLKQNPDKGMEEDLNQAEWLLYSKYGMYV